MNPALIKKILEAALLSAREPMGLHDLKKLFDEPLSGDVLRKLLDELRDLMDEFEESHTIDSDVLAGRLDAWFSRHFESHDARLHKALGTHPH